MAPDVQQRSEAVSDYLADRRDAMVDLLIRLVEIETPSSVAATQEALFEVLDAESAGRGWRVRRLGGARSGGQLVVRGTHRRAAPIQVLIGHCDTVWPLGTLAERPVTIRDGRLHGPGAYDMKAGLVQALFAMEAVEVTIGAPAVTPVLFVNSDEEIGSHESTVNIRRLARVADRALVLEPSLGPAGLLKTARKGVARFTITVEGRAAHAGLQPEQGASAILELSMVVQTLFALNDPGQGVTVNVGMIDGGIRPNVVAPRSSATVDVRVRSDDDARRVDEAIRGLRPTTPGTTITVEGGFGRPPMMRTPGTAALFERARRLGGTLGVDLEEGAAGGGSDGNTTSALVPTLDGLGAVGDGAHSPDEYVEVDRMPERAALLALLVAEPPIAHAPGEGAPS